MKCAIYEATTFDWSCQTQAIERASRRRELQQGAEAQGWRLTAPNSAWHMCAQPRAQSSSLKGYVSGLLESSLSRISYTSSPCSSQRTHMQIRRSSVQDVDQKGKGPSAGGMRRCMQPRR